MSENLQVFAGPGAYDIIKDEGLSPESISVVAGAAGGPKWLVLYGLDKAIFSHWLTDIKGPVYLIGSSIGAWRFAAIVQGVQKGMEAYDIFKEAYIEQTYSGKPTSVEVSREAMRILAQYLDDNGVDDALNHPFLRLNVLAVRSRFPVSMESKYPLTLGVFSAGLLNAVSKKTQRFFFARTLFYDPRNLPPFFRRTEDTRESFDRNYIPTYKVALTPENIREVVLASGSIPVVMEGVNNIPGAPPGLYRDGGLIDYHIDIPYGEIYHDPEDEDSRTSKKRKIILFPHYMERIIPGWLDKRLTWRKPDPANMEDVVLICPSRSFVKNLRYAKIPDRMDFERFVGRDRERIAYWRRVVDESLRLGDEFLEMLETGNIKNRVKRLEL